METGTMVANRRRDRHTWDMKHLHRHLQGVVDLEIWTIPYYMSAMYSIKDPASVQYRMIQDVIHQEMLHAQLAANIANAFGLSPKFEAPTYEGDTIPHVDFDLDTPNPTQEFSPFSAEIGPLDLTRLNTMCLIEYPAWNTQRTPDLRERQKEYGSIAEFYDAVRMGMYQLREHLTGGVNQVDEFKYYYNNFPDFTITRDGTAGYQQAVSLIDVITDQGEGQAQGDVVVAVEHQNTADGYEESWAHYEKFRFIRAMPKLPATYIGEASPPPGSPGHDAQQVLIREFAAFLKTLEALFSGQDPADFGPRMAKIGGAVLTCWKKGAIPRFS